MKYFFDLSFYFGKSAFSTEHVADNRVFGSGLDIPAKRFRDFCRQAFQVQALVACRNGDFIPDEACFNSYTADVEIFDAMSFFRFFVDQSIPFSGYAPGIFEQRAK